MSVKVAVRYSVRSLASAHPLVYLPIARRKYGTLGHRIVRADTELVIDGFERSGNWFAVAAFLAAQRRPVKVAHHLHAPAQVAAAVESGVPTVVLVRNPVDAVVSQMIRSRGVRPRQALAAWTRYYSHVLPLREWVVVADFERVTGDLGDVTAEVNAKFATDFELFESTAVNVQACFAWIDEVNRARYGRLVETAVGRPSATREQMKAEVFRRVRAPDCAARVAEATALYVHLLVGDEHDD